MTNIWILVVVATIITTIINFLKPWYEGLVKKKYVTTISILISFVLWIIASFSIDFWLELNLGSKIILWLALWTGSTIWYDLWEVIKSFETKLKSKE